MCALPLVYVHVTAEYPPVPVLVQPQVQLQALILLQDLPPKLVLEMARLLLAEVPKLALVLESQEPGQAARLVLAELQAEPRPEQEQPPE